MQPTPYQMEYPLHCAIALASVCLCGDITREKQHFPNLRRVGILVIKRGSWFEVQFSSLRVCNCVLPRPTWVHQQHLCRENVECWHEPHVTRPFSPVPGMQLRPKNTGQKTQQMAPEMNVTFMDKTQKRLDLSQCCTCVTLRRLPTGVA